MTREPIILSLETATRAGGVYLARGPVKLAERTGDSQVSHSNSLLADINRCLEEAQLSLQDLDVLACATGPGSFTGLRIGIATLKALAATLQLPSVGVPTLHAIAHAAGPSPVTIALLPAGRGEVFAQKLSVSHDGTVTELDEARHLSPEKLIERYAALVDVIWAGEGAHAQRQLLEQQSNESSVPFIDLAAGPQSPSQSWRLAPASDNLAEHVAILALRRFEDGRIQSPQSLSANYVRPSDPELKDQCR